jgi:hypothetical protein
MWPTILSPKPNKRWVPVAEYEKNLVNSYPEGIRNLGLNLDSAQYGKVIPEGTNKYYINGYIDKFFSGKYQDKIIHRDNAKYDFKVSFERDENTFKNFKLSSIDKFGVNLYQSDSKNITTELPSIKIEPINRKGLQYSLEIGFGAPIYDDPNLTRNNYLDWKLKTKSFYSANLVGRWYFNGFTGLSGALGFSHSVIQTSLNGDYQNTNYTLDLDNMSHLNRVSATIDSTLNFNYIQIPVNLILHSSSSPEKWSIFAELGLETTFLVNSTYQISGHYKTSGYYEQNPEGGQYLDDAAYGYIERKMNGESKDLKLNRLNLLLHTAIGVTYPLDYFTTVYLGVQYNKGFSDLTKDKTYTDYLGNNLQAEKRTLSSYGLKFGINYKF